MKPAIKYGLIVGVVGLVLNVCVSGLVGICGPFFTLGLGVLAAFLAVREEKPALKAEGAKSGALAGGLSGFFLLIGQMLGGVAALVLVQNTGMQTLLGNAPAPSADASLQITYYLAGLGTGFCFGAVGLVLGALAGAGTGYLTTSEASVGQANF